MFTKSKKNKNSLKFIKKNCHLAKILAKTNFYEQSSIPKRKTGQRWISFCISCCSFLVWAMVDQDIDQRSRCFADYLELSAVHASDHCSLTMSLILFLSRVHKVLNIVHSLLPIQQNCFRHTCTWLFVSCTHFVDAFQFFYSFRITRSITCCTYCLVICYYDIYKTCPRNQCV